MIRALELFWLAFMVLCLVGALFMAFSGERMESFLLCGCALVAGFKYFVRNRQRRQMDKR